MIVALGNKKGGVGKTTITVNLAGALAELGRSVLILDLDPQGNATRWLRREDDGERLHRCLTAGTSLYNIVFKTKVSGVDIIPCGAAVEGSEIALIHESVERGKRETYDPEGEPAFRLRELLRTGEEARWDYVLIDCRPSIGQLVVNALCAADAAIIVGEPTGLSRSMTDQFVASVVEIKEALAPQLILGGVILNRMFQERECYQNAVRFQLDYGGLLFTAKIGDHAMIRRSSDGDVWNTIVKYAKASSAADEFRALAQEFDQRAQRNFVPEESDSLFSTPEL